VQQAAEREVSHIALPQAGRIVIVQFLKKHDDNNKTHEYTRRDACEALETIRRYQLEEFTIVDETGRDLSLTYAEGLVLGSYQFLKYYKDAELSYLTAQKLSEEIAGMSKDAGFTLEVFDKEKITALKMGGLLAVNRGSFDPPTFNILEWKPDNAKNDR